MLLLVGICLLVCGGCLIFAYGYYGKKYEQYTKEYERFDKPTLKIFNLFGKIGLWLALATVIMFIPNSIVADNTPWSEWECYGTTTITAIEDNSNINGKFGGGFYTRGTIDEVVYYYYMEQHNDGAQKMSKVPYDKTLIYENNSEKPRVDFYKREQKQFLWIVPCYMTYTEYSYKIYVPESTVTTDYNIDMN